MSIERLNRFLLNELFAQNRTRKNRGKETSLPEITAEFIYNFSTKLKQSIELYYQSSSPNDSNFGDTEKIILEHLGRLTNYGQNILAFAIYQKEKKSKY